MSHNVIRTLLASLAAIVVAIGVSGAVSADPGTDLVGDPNAASQYWGPQHSDDCALMSVADVVGELTGFKPSEDEVIAVAMATPSSKEGAPPIYVPPPDAGGPPPDPAVPRRNQLPVIRDLPKLLAHYGIPSRLTDDAIAANGGPPTGIPGLYDALRDGKKVIVSLNGETIRDESGDRSIHDHDVVVTGLDAATGIVHVNDSLAAGPNLSVPVDVFDTAWRTSDHAMVLAG